MPWFFEDETTAFTERLLDAAGSQVMWAPALWVIECANVLQGAQRRRRIDRLAATHGPNAYDASYLELALRRSSALVSFDARLIAAARSIGHPVLAAVGDLPG